MTAGTPAGRAPEARVAAAERIIQKLVNRISADLGDDVDAYLDQIEYNARQAAERERDEERIRGDAHKNAADGWLARFKECVAERDEAREVVAKVNNSFGSYGYFTDPHPADQVERLKAQTREDWREIERLRAHLAEREGGRTPEAGVWLVERLIDGRPHWLAWRNRRRCEWVTDANHADQFDWEIAASREARLVAETQGVECRATEHIFVSASPTSRAPTCPTCAEREGDEMQKIDTSRPLGSYTDEELAVLPHTFAHKKVGCDTPGPGCPGVCVATCENIVNLRLATIRLHAALAERAGQLVAAQEGVVLKPWVLMLPWRQQSTLFSALRGPDIPSVAAQEIVRWIRGVVQKDACEAEGIAHLCTYMLDERATPTRATTGGEHFQHHLDAALRAIAERHPEASIASVARAALSASSTSRDPESSGSLAAPPRPRDPGNASP